MPDCGVCIGGGDFDGFPEFQHLTWPKARKPHKCVECRRAIAVGETYRRYVSKFDGSLSCDCTCAVCAEIEQAFTCGGAACVGELWRDMADVVFPEMTTGCLERLETAAAKAYLLERWRRWKFAQG